MCDLIWKEKNKKPTTVFTVPTIKGLKATEFSPPMLQMEKVRSREGEALIPGHTASQWLSRNSNPGLIPREEFWTMAFLKVSGGSPPWGLLGGKEGGLGIRQVSSHPAAFIQSPLLCCHILGFKVFDQMVLWVGRACWEVMRGNTGEDFSGAKHFLEWDPPPSIPVLPSSL